jgi:hypothetical protein
VRTKNQKERNKIPLAIQQVKTIFIRERGYFPCSIVSREPTFCPHRCESNYSEKKKHIPTADLLYRCSVYNLLIISEKMFRCRQSG